jgi:hypothetical protein
MCKLATRVLDTEQSNRKIKKVILWYRIIVSFVLFIGLILILSFGTFEAYFLIFLTVWNWLFLIPYFLV